MRTPRNRRDMRPDSGRARGRRGTATQIMNSDISEVQDRLRERLISLTYERPARRTERSLTSLYPAAVRRLRRGRRRAEEPNRTLGAFAGRSPLRPRLRQRDSLRRQAAVLVSWLPWRRTSSLARDQAAAGGVPTRQRCGRRGRRLLPCASDSQGACWRTEAGCAEQADRSRRARRSVAQSER